MKNALILHGAQNNSSGNWFPWLKEKLEKKAFKVWVPDMPNAEKPILKDWLYYIFSNKNWIFNADSIIIGHSAGATFTLKVIESLPGGIIINKAIMVSPFAGMGKLKWTYKYKRSLVEKPMDFKKTKKSCRNFYFFASNNDKYDCGIDQAEILQKHLGGEIILKPGEGHFNLETDPKYKQLPELLEYI